MSLTYILIDFENVKPTAAELKLIRGSEYRVRVFHGSHQNKFDADIVKTLQPLGGQVEYIQSERSGKNALDFHIAFYLGRLIPEAKGAVPAPEKPTRFFIVSKDSGFDVLLGHIRELGYGAARAATVREALSGETTDAAVISNPVTAAKPAKTAKPKPAPIPEKGPAVKAEPVKPKSNSASPQPSKADPWARAIEHLRDHPQNRPTSIKTLERHLATLLGKETLPEAVKDLIARLQREGLVVVTGKKIEYNIPS
jgi:PIN domain